MPERYSGIHKVVSSCGPWNSSCTTNLHPGFFKGLGGKPGPLGSSGTKVVVIVFTFLQNDELRRAACRVAWSGLLALAQIAELPDLCHDMGHVVSILARHIKNEPSASQDGKDLVQFAGENH